MLKAKGIKTIVRNAGMASVVSRVGKKEVLPHTGREHNRVIGEDTHQKGSDRNSRADRVLNVMPASNCKLGRNVDLLFLTMRSFIALF